VIDFRYHLVSIISIFLALAVGIVLGAGPLKEQIGDTLTQEVTQLRKDKSDLRAQVDQAQKAATVHDGFESGSLPRIVSGQLANRAVALVVLPGAKSDLVDATKQTITEAGGTVVTTTTVQSAWAASSASDVEAQQQLATELSGPLGVPAPSATSSPKRGDPGPLAALLAAVLVRRDLTTGTVDSARTALAELVKQGLVDTDAAALKPASTAVILGGPIAGTDVDVRTAAAHRYAALAGALDAAGDGAVLASDVGVAGSSDAASVVRAARGDSGIAAVLSTVDNGSQPMGQASIVMALAEQVTGGTGQYGLESGVSAPYAPFPTP
jgi:hypothetical protein